MPDFPLSGNFAKVIQLGLDETAVSGTTITANASANTVGSFVEFISDAANAETSSYLIVALSPGSENSYLVNVAIGGAGSEQVIVPNLMGHPAGNAMGIFIYTIPISIPSGERISVQCQCDSGGATIDVHLARGLGSFKSGSACSKITTYGANTVDSGGVTVVRGTNTFGSWTEIDASIANKIAGFVIVGVRKPTSWTNASFVVYEVAVGSAGNEEVIYSGSLALATSAEIISGPVSQFIPVSVAAGERLSVRASGNINNADLDFDYIIYGVS